MLQITDLTFNAWGRKFLEDASVSLPPGSKVGLVGRNGIGKSTLFKLILGELAAGGDEISLPKTARIGSVDQEHPATPVSVLETILEADEERHSLLGRLETAEPEEMGEIWTRLIEIDADAARRTSSGRCRNIPAAGACGWRWPPPCSPSRTCCCSTSRPTI